MLMNVLENCRLLIYVFKYRMMRKKITTAETSYVFY